MASLTERMIGAARLDVKTYEEVEHDQSATGQAMLVVLLSAVAAGIGALAHGPGMIVAALVGALVGWFIWAGLTYLIGTKLMPEPATSADFGQLLRTIGFSASPGVLNVLQIIPVVGWIVGFLVGVWQLVAMVVAVRQALDYSSTGRAVVVCLIGWVVYLVVGAVIGLTLGAGAGLANAMGT